MGRAIKKVTLYQINLCKCIALNFETKPMPRINEKRKKVSREHGEANLAAVVDD